MTLVLQTATGTDPQSDSAIQAVLARYQIQAQGAPMDLGTETFSYFNIDEQQDSEALINELMGLPAVVSAFIKPMGAPPM